MDEMIETLDYNNTSQHVIYHNELLRCGVTDDDRALQILYQVVIF